MMTCRAFVLAAALALGAASSTLAHHGWAWTEDEESTLTGTIRSIHLGNPHAALEVEAEDGIWQVDLAPPARTAAAGFVEGVAAPGDVVVAHGHRSRDAGEKRMKAERIEVNGRTYDVYPNRD